MIRRTTFTGQDRSHFIGGSEARVIMGKDEKALARLWREKRGESVPLDLSKELVVQLGLVTEDLNRRWYEQSSGNRIGQVQRHAIHRTIPWMAATLDGLVKETGAVFEAKFMLPWSFSEEAAGQKHMAQLQHNMLVAKPLKNQHKSPWLRRDYYHPVLPPSQGQCTEDLAPIPPSLTSRCVVLSCDPLDRVEKVELAFGLARADAP